MTKKQKRPQAQKPIRSRSIETMEFQLQGRGGRHKAVTDYKRKPKHVNRGWE